MVTTYVSVICSLLTATFWKELDIIAMSMLRAINTAAMLYSPKIIFPVTSVIVYSSSIILNS